MQELGVNSVLFEGLHDIDVIQEAARNNDSKLPSLMA